MGWTATSPRYQKTRWYCGPCRKRTTIELNSEWVAAGKPLKWEGRFPWEWFTRCSVCKTEHWSESYCCPNCGCPSEPWESPDYQGTCVEMTKPVVNPRYSYEYGSTGYDWSERHRCPKCGTKYWFTNSTH